MHKVYTTRGFVFKKNDVLDTDRNFSVFTQDFGRVEVFAKAIRKVSSKLKGGMDIFHIADIEFVQGKHKKTLTDAVLVKKFPDLVQIPEKFQIAKKVSEILHTFLKGQQIDQKIWEQITDFFEKLNLQDLALANTSFVCQYFFWNFISVLGYAPQLFKCAHCGNALNPSLMYFSNKEGGVLCQNCLAHDKQAIKVNEDTVKVMRLLVNKEWETLFKLKVNPSSVALLEKISDNYHRYLASIVN